VKRRAFITLLGGAAAAWSLAARAQQDARMRRIVMLNDIAEGDLDAQTWIGAFRRKFGQFGLERGPQSPDRHSLGGPAISLAFAATPRTSSRNLFEG
jgi:hypothetical protein